MCSFVQMTMVMSLNHVFFVYLKILIIKKMMIMCPTSIWSPSRMIGLAFDGANMMTGRHSGIVI
jgi:hypothetical protein